MKNLFIKKNSSSEEIDRKKEKLELINNLRKVDRTHWTKKNVDELMDLVETICLQYKELYVKQYFGSFSDQFADLVFNKNTVEDYCFGSYLNKSNKVVINLANFTQDRLLNFGSKLLHTLNYMAVIGHEYEHNFQYKGELYKETLIKDNKNFKARVSNLVDKYAYEIVDSVHDFSIKKDDLQNILEVTDLKSFFNDNYPDLSEDEILENLRSSIYFKSYVEVDARAVERQIFKNFVDELSVLDKSHSILSVAEYKINEANESEKEVQTGYMDFFYQKYVDAIKNINSHLVHYMQKIYESSQKEYYAALKQYIDDGTKMPNAFAVLETDILQKVFKLLCSGFSKDFTLTGGGIQDYTKDVTNLRLFFAKQGLGLFSSYLMDTFPYSAKMDEEYINQYYKFLRRGKITFDCFFDAELLNKSKILDLFSTYISRGQTEFCDKLLFELDKETIKTILSETNLLEQLDARLDSLSKANLQNKNYIVFDGENGTFNDIDDMVSLIGQFCFYFNVPYYNEYMQQDEIKQFCKDELEQKIKMELYRLYLKAEQIAKKAATKIEGRELGPEEYRFDHAQDRAYYKLQQEKSEVRFIHLYGISAYEHQDYQYNVQQKASEILHSS